ncbi:MAG: glycine cleavage system aminomethyltransferase GcvT [Thermodesulfobacteriota bacterium]|nr:glycine cleavage system aminomethyltransferase GcvT [Thermodesulfobacteriota bacterium]
MEKILKTVLYDRHQRHGAQMVEFGGWYMPLQYSGGILDEHLATRNSSGLFDVSHMGRFIIRGRDALPFLQYLLTNNAQALDIGESQYTIISNENGGAVDDVYLYRFKDGEYLLVVNASNREKDWHHLQSHKGRFDDVQMTDKTQELAMLSLQGPLSKDILSSIITAGTLPDPARNALSTIRINGSEVQLARTGYTGEPICFELFIPGKDAGMIWDLLTEKGARPVGLGARDTLRLEAGLPLYGHELGHDPDGKEIPIFASRASRFAVSFSPLKGSFIGCHPLTEQSKSLKKIMNKDYSLIDHLPRLIMPVAIVAKGIARAGFKVFHNDRHVGYVTSGTMVPFWQSRGTGVSFRLTEEKSLRSICLALLDSNLVKGDELQIEIRNKRTEAVIVPYHMSSKTPPFARAIILKPIQPGIKQ